VQNSAGTTLLSTQDDATTTLAGKTYTGTGTILVPAQSHSASDIVMKGDSALISANGNTNQWGKIVLCDNGAYTTYQNYGTGHLFKIGTTSPTTYLQITPVQDYHYQDRMLLIFTSKQALIFMVVSYLLVVVEIQYLKTHIQAVHIYSTTHHLWMEL
jgi:hypothetical protein